MEFKSSPKKFNNYKANHPKQTISDAKKFVKKLGLKIECSIGIVKIDKSRFYSATITCNNNGQDVYLVSGKGVTLDLCMASAYAELVERLLSDHISLSDFVKVPSRRLKRKEDEKIEIKEFLRYFQIKDSLNKDDFAWREAFDVLKNKKVAIPYDFIRVISGSNGLAAGNTVEEAFVQAFFEICERYSFIEYITKKIPAKTIDKRTIENKRLLSFIELFEELNFEIEIKDLTLDNNIPVMGVLFTNNNLKYSEGLIKDVHFKALVVGAHFNIEEAISRCFMEKLQTFHCDVSRIMFPGKIRYSNFESIHSELDIFKHYYEKSEIVEVIKVFKKDLYKSYFRDQIGLENFEYFEKGKVIPFSNLKNIKTNDFLEDITEIKKILKKNKWKAIIIDHSIRKCPIKVIRLVVPSVSDILSYFKKGKMFKNYREIEADMTLGQFDIKKINGKNPKEKYSYLKYNLLPKSVLWFNSSRQDPIEILKTMFKILQKDKNNKEIAKIKKFFKQMSISIDC